MKTRIIKIPNFEIIDEIKIPDKPFTVRDINTRLTKRGIHYQLRLLESQGVLKSKMAHVRYTGEKACIYRVYQKVEI